VWNRPLGAYDFLGLDLIFNMQVSSGLDEVFVGAHADKKTHLTYLEVSHIDKEGHKRIGSKDLTPGSAFIDKPSADPEYGSQGDPFDHLPNVSAMEGTVRLPTDRRVRRGHTKEFRVAVRGWEDDPPKCGTDCNFTVLVIVTEKSKSLDDPTEYVADVSDRSHGCLPVIKMSKRRHVIPIRARDASDVFFVEPGAGFTP